jgi:hypothetical protein
MNKCKICNHRTKEIFRKIVLQKYDVGYHQCENCGFIQTDKPFWLAEAYENAITSLDLGLIQRNINLKEEVSLLIDVCFKESQFFLDYAGGYGMFTRMMRDKGFNFFHHDDYCENLFSKHFELKDNIIEKYDLVTAFEVLEHLENPLDEIKKIFNLGIHFIFTTEIIPENFNQNWMYISQETGQHIAFYTKKSLEIVAELNGFNYYCKNNFIHIFTKKALTENNIYIREKYTKYFGLKTKYKTVKSKIKRESLLQKDYDYIKNILNSKR